MKNKLVLLGMGLVMCVLGSACAVLDPSEEAQSQSQPPAASGMQVVDIKASDRVKGRASGQLQADSMNRDNQPQSYTSGQNAYKGRPLPQHIGDYVQGMAQDLIANMERVSNKTPIAITHFAVLDSDLQQTNLLGQQMAESFVHEMHKFRIPVLDFKATDYIRVTEQGDFVLSRDYLELDSNLPVEYVLTGTMTRHQGGVLVNARILGLDSRAVVASAQMLIPFYVVDALIPSDGKIPPGQGEGVKLSRG